MAELHVAAATGIAPSAAGGISFEAVGPGQWSFRVLEAYRPVLKSMVEAQQQGAAAVPTHHGPERARPRGIRRARRPARAVRPHPRPGVLGHAVRFGRRAPGPARLRAVRAPAARGPSRRPCCSCRATSPASRRTGACPLQEVQLWVCLRELTMHAVLTRPGVRSSLATLLGDASAHAAAAQKSIVERLGDGLGDPAALEDALGDPEALLSDLISPEQRNISDALTAQTTAIGACRRPHHVVDRADADLLARRTARGVVPLPDRGGQGRAGLRRPVRPRRRPGRGRPGPRTSSPASSSGPARTRSPACGATSSTCPRRPRWTRPGSGSPASACWTDPAGAEASAADAGRWRRPDAVAACELRAASDAGRRAALELVARVNAVVTRPPATASRSSRPSPARWRRRTPPWPRRERIVVSRSTRSNMCSTTAPLGKVRRGERAHQRRLVLGQRRRPASGSLGPPVPRPSCRCHPLCLPPHRRASARAVPTSTGAHASTAGVSAEWPLRCNPGAE